jgi:hypothetical protein
MDDAPVLSSNVDVDSRAESALCPTPSSTSPVPTLLCAPIDPVRSDGNEHGIRAEALDSSTQATRELGERQTHQAQCYLGGGSQCEALRASLGRSDLGRRQLSLMTRWQELGCPTPTIAPWDRTEEGRVEAFEEWLDSLEAKVSQQNVDVDSRAESALCPTPSSASPVPGSHEQSGSDLAPGTDRIEGAGKQPRLSRGDFLRQLDCPTAFQALAGTGPSRQACQEMLDLWRAAGRPDPEEWLQMCEKISQHTVD